MNDGRFKPTHGGSNTRLYNTWAQMLGRCNNPRNRNYRNYGERGITVCKRWETFANFRADMGNKPSPKHTLDRINTDGNYEPRNCRWAVIDTQIKNKRKYRAINGFTLEEMLRELDRRGYTVTITKRGTRFFLP